MATPAQRDELSVLKGNFIFRQGDPGHEMFVISAGRVRLTIGSAGHEKEVAVLGPGAFFGELSLLSDEPRTATAEAMEDSTLLAIGRDVFAMMVQDDLDIVFRMMNIQGQRLSQTNQPIQDLVQRLGRVRIAACALKRFMTAGAFPAAVSVAELAAEIGLSAPIVDATVADLVQRGAGSATNGRWTLQSREQLDTLVGAVCAYAQAH
jgi:CRP/FNR family transcriptional regulator, cyclic AMP receptor protein